MPSEKLEIQLPFPIDVMISLWETGEAQIEEDGEIVTIKANLKQNMSPEQIKLYGCILKLCKEKSNDN